MLGPPVAINRRLLQISRPHRGLMFSVLCLLLLLSMAKAKAGFRVRAAQQKGQNFLFLEDIATYYGMTYGKNKDAVTLSSKYSRIELAVGHRDAVINKTKVYLNHSPGLWKTHPTLSEPDFRLLVDPIMRSQALRRRYVRRVMIDPGHGGRDPGARGKRIREKDLTLKLANQLAQELRKRGYTVALTRETDKTLQLRDRTAVAKRWRADLFVSVHANVTTSKKVRGIETFVLAPVGCASTHGGKTRKTASSGNAFDRENALLAYSIQQHLITTTQAVDRGLKRAEFVVLDTASCPAVLIETGFMSNPAEEICLTTPTHQAKLIRGIVDGIRHYQLSLAPK